MDGHEQPALTGRTARREWGNVREAEVDGTGECEVSQDCFVGGPKRGSGPRQGMRRRGIGGYPGSPESLKAAMSSMS